jgi:hypothetical protein
MVKGVLITFAMLMAPVLFTSSIMMLITMSLCVVDALRGSTLLALEETVRTLKDCVAVLGVVLLTLEFLVLRATLVLLSMLEWLVETSN